jgi:hypothetical protein
VLGEIETLAAKRGGPDSRSALKHEAQALAELAEGAADAGLQIPSLVDASFTSGLSIVVESAVPGRPMAGLIREGHCDIGKLAARLAEWLAGWNARTVRHVELTPALADRWILSPARELASELEHGAAYQAWLAAQTARLLSRPVPLVAAHNDLTMANVLGDRSGPRSVVDWEVASADGMPLTDFVYVVWDAAAIANGGDRVSAFGECFRDNGRWRAAVGECEARLRTVVGGPDEWLDLCFHAAWLCHAANEQARSPSRRDPAFLGIVRELADAVLGGRRKLLSS